MSALPASPGPAPQAPSSGPTSPRPTLGLVTRPMAGVPAPPSRHTRRRARRRLVREQVLVVLVMLALLGITVVLLCLEWLASGSVTGT